VDHKLNVTQYGLVAVVLSSADKELRRQYKTGRLLLTLQCLYLHGPRMGMEETVMPARNLNDVPWMQHLGCNIWRAKLWRNHRDYSRALRRRCSGGITFIVEARMAHLI